MKSILPGRTPPGAEVRGRWNTGPESPKNLKLPSSLPCLGWSITPPFHHWLPVCMYGVLADGGFTLNHKSDHIQICGYNPHRFPPRGRLTPEQKEYNKKLSEMRVVVENSIESENLENPQGDISALEVWKRSNQCKWYSYCCCGSIKS